MSVASDTPSPGIYPGVPFDTYTQWRALSNSRINLAMKSMRHYREVKFTEATKSLRLGQFVHCGVLEPLSVPLRYAVMPKYEFDPGNVTADGGTSTSKATKYYKAKASEFAKVNSDKSIIDVADYMRLLGVGRSLAESAKAKEVLGGSGEAEVSVVWRDDDTGLLCKGRFDWLRRGELIADLKTTADASDFSNSIARYGYHRQAAFYQAGYAALTGGELLPFYLLAVEPVEPFASRVAALNDDAIETGAAELRDVMRRIAEAKASNVYPCYDDPRVWALPSWYAGKSDGVELTIGGESVSI